MSYSLVKFVISSVLSKMFCWRWNYGFFMCL